MNYDEPDGHVGDGDGAYIRGRVTYVARRSQYRPRPDALSSIELGQQMRLRAEGKPVADADVKKGMADGSSVSA